MAITPFSSQDRFALFLSEDISFTPSTTAIPASRTCRKLYPR
jgi:hypothetical protein